MIYFISNRTITGWSQLQQTVIVDARKFLPLYLHISGGHLNAALTQTNRAGIQQGDQFFQDVRPDPTFRLGIPTISAMIHPTFEVIKTTECACNDNSQDWNDETSVVIQLPFPLSPRTLQDSINSFLTSKEVKICWRCNQRQIITTTKRLRKATPVLAISIERVDHNTGKRIDLDVNITTPVIRLPVIAEELVANYELTSAIQRTTLCLYYEERVDNLSVLVTTMTLKWRDIETYEKLKSTYLRKMVSKAACKLVKIHMSHGIYFTQKKTLQFLSKTLSLLVLVFYSYNIFLCITVILANKGPV